MINLRACHAVMSKEEPEAKDWLREDIKNGVCNDFGVHVSDACTVGHTPDTVERLVSVAQKGDSVTDIG